MHWIDLLLARYYARMSLSRLEKILQTRSPFRKMDSSFKSGVQEGTYFVKRETTRFGPGHFRRMGENITPDLENLLASLNSFSASDKVELERIATQFEKTAASVRRARLVEGVEQEREISESVYQMF